MSLRKCKSEVTLKQYITDSRKQLEKESYEHLYGEHFDIENEMCVRQNNCFDCGKTLYSDNRFCTKCSNFRDKYGTICSLYILIDALCMFLYVMQPMFWLFLIANISNYLCTATVFVYLFDAHGIEYGRMIIMFLTIACIIYLCKVIDIIYSIKYMYLSVFQLYYNFSQEDKFKLMKII